MSYLSPVDVANRALQHLGATRIDASLGFAENSLNASETAFAYDILRKAELRTGVWRFAIRKAILRPIDSNTMLLVPTMWASTTTYFVGSIVSDQTGQLWSSKTRNNLGNDPTQTTQWEQYFGPVTVMKYDSSTAYFDGELVYTAPGDGSYSVYRSLQNSNAVDPSLPNQWAATTTYFQNQVVQVFPAWLVGTTYTQGQTVQYTDGNVYSSLTNGNLGNIPAPGSSFWALAPVLTLTTQPVPATGLTSPPLRSPVIEWAVSTTYSAGAFVMFNGTEYLSTANSNAGNYPNVPASVFWEPLTGGTLYMSLVDLNYNNPPATSPSQWTTSFTQGGGNQMWTQIGGAAFPMGVGLVPFNITYPLSIGPVSQSNVRNVYRLPNGFLREAPRDPKAGSASYLGSPTNLQYTDWNLEGDFIVSRDVDPIMYRFVADLTNVREMDVLFLEYVATRLATELCERITQSSDKLKILTSVYTHAERVAKAANSIETGATEPPLDDYIATRL